MSEIPTIEEENAPPRLLDKAVRDAKREAREWRQLIMLGKSGTPAKLQRREELRQRLTIDKITEEDNDVDSQNVTFVDSVALSVERLSIVDEAVSRETRTSDHPTTSKRDSTRRTKVKSASDCEPVALKFTEKDIMDIIGVPDAPTPSATQPKLDESVNRTSKNAVYPRISAATIPTLRIKGHQEDLSK